MVYGLVILFNGNLAYSSCDNTVNIWNLYNGSLLYTGHTDGVYALAVLSNGRLASSSFDSTVKKWH